MGWAERDNEARIRSYYERTGHGMLKFSKNMNMFQNEYMLALEGVKAGVITPEECKDMFFEVVKPK